MLSRHDSVRHLGGEEVPAAEFVDACRIGLLAQPFVFGDGHDHVRRPPLGSRKIGRNGQTRGEPARSA
jgi:hypothetical protein